VIEAKLSEMEGKEFEALRRRADRNAHGHISQSLRLQVFDDIATLITAIGGALVMFLSALLIGLEYANKMAEIAVAIVGSAITLVAVWQAIWQPSKRARNHHLWATRFFAIEDECRLCLGGLGSADLPKLMKEMLAVTAQADLIPEHHWKRDRAKGRAAS